MMCPQTLAAKRIFGMLLMAALLSSCATRRARTYVNPETDFPAYTRVAILPFENLTEEDYANAQVTNLFVTEFMIGGGMEVVEPNLTVAALSAMGKSADFRREGLAGLPPEILRDLGKKLQVQALLAGSVEQFGDVRIGTESFPVVALSTTLVDAETGTVIWRVSQQARGGPGIPFVGTGESYTRIELAQKVCQKIVRSVAKEVKWFTRNNP